jgi:hypothetical protein
LVRDAVPSEPVSTCFHLLFSEYQVRRGPSAVIGQANQRDRLGIFISPLYKGRHQEQGNNRGETGGKQGQGTGARR